MKVQFLERMKTILDAAFYRNFRTNDGNTDASRVAEAYAMVCTAETKLEFCSKASVQAEVGDNFDAMQTMKRKLRAQFELATRGSERELFDDTIQMARTYAGLIESQAAQLKP
jgi:hypothetical protein